MKFPQQRDMASDIIPGLDPCLDQNLGRRRIFWTTIQGACGTYNNCGHNCGIPGLQYVELTDGRTISTDDRLQSLVLNILNTRARSDLKCPAPSAIYGHWSESYRDDNLWIGSRIWNNADKSYSSVQDAVKAVGAAVKGDLMKLTVLGIADDVQVVTSYLGRNTVGVVITVTAGSNKSTINLSGTYASNTWIWH
jgi:hypothetical protein